MAVVNQILDYLVNNYALYMVITMSMIVSFVIGALALIKIPVKKLTSKIPNEKLRTLANKVLILIAFVIATLCWLLLELVLPKYFSCEATSVFLSGAFAIVVYALGDGVINSQKAKEMVEEIITEAEKTEKVEQPKQPKHLKSDAEKEFWKKIKK